MTLFSNNPRKRWRNRVRRQAVERGLLDPFSQDFAFFGTNYTCVTEVPFMPAIMTILLQTTKLALHNIVPNYANVAQEFECILRLLVVFYSAYSTNMRVHDTTMKTKKKKPFDGQPATLKPTEKLNNLLYCKLIRFSLRIMSTRIALLEFDMVTAKHTHRRHFLL